ncbi:hypothetical protein DSM25558_2719 [Agrobacterium sp. DSM 25558]|nr:hypothetical protein DSM25558_2719 [Agrobacterium sp. DSM 25558]
MWFWARFDHWADVHMAFEGNRLSHVITFNYKS